MREKDIASIGDIYGKMLNSVRTIKESKQPKTFDGEFRSKKQKDGPENADGYNKAENKKKEDDNEEDEEDDVSKYLPKKKISLEDAFKSAQNAKGNVDKGYDRFDKRSPDYDDPTDDGDDDEDEEDDVSKYLTKTKMTKTSDKMKEKLKNPNLSDKDRKIINKSLKNIESGLEASESEEIEESKKIATQMLNKHMSKSAFDKLFNKVLKENFGQPEEGDDLDALGLDDSTPDSDMGDDFGGDEDFGDEGDSVTFTLDRNTAQTLIDVLQGALGGEDEGEGDDELDFGDEGDDMDFGDEGDDMDFEEDEEEGTKVAPDKKAAFQAKSNKVGGKANPKGGNKAKTDVTDDTGTKTTTPSIAALQGKSNQVPGSTLKAKQDYFR